MPSNDPKKISIANPPTGTGRGKSPGPKPKERNPDPHARENQRTRVMDGREAERRRTMESIQQGADYIMNGPPRTIDARNTLSARGGSAGGGGGSGGGGGQGYPEGSVRAALERGLLGASPLKAQASVQGAQPYREEQGPRRMEVRPTQQPSVQQYLAQQLLGRVSTTGYSPGVLATRERQRAQQELAGLGLPQEAQAAALARIQQGDTGVVNRAAQLVSQVPPQAMGRGAVGRYLAEKLLGDAGAQEFDARRQADLTRYRQVAQANTERAQGNSAQAIKFGMNPLASEQQLVAEQRRRNQQAYPSADLTSLQKLAAAGDMDAARAIEGTPGPWAPGDPNLGVRRRTQMREDEEIRNRYVAPEQVKAGAQLSKQQLIQAGKSEAEANRMLIEQNKLVERQYEAQLKAAGWDQRQAAQLAMQFGRTNTLRLQNGLEPLTVGDYHAAVQQLAPQGRVAPAAPNFQAPPPPAGPMGAAPTGGQGPVPAMAAPPSAEAQSFSAEFSSLPPHEKQQVIADLEASGDAANAAYFRSLMGQ